MGHVMDENPSDRFTNLNYAQLKQLWQWVGYLNTGTYYDRMVSQSDTIQEMKDDLERTQ